MKLDLTQAAREDLRSIRDYTLAKWGEAQEHIYLDRMWLKFEQIAQDSTVYRFRHDLFPDCQIASEGKHVILFRVKKEVLQVARVLHGAMDFKRHLPKQG
jgi:plasmid stabilization system protein ParE